MLGLFPVIDLDLIVFLLPTSVPIHDFRTLQDPRARVGGQVDFLRNLVLVWSVAHRPPTLG